MTCVTGGEILMLEGQSQGHAFVYCCCVLLRNPLFSTLLLYK